jgi:hypothetical protein
MNVGLWAEIRRLAEIDKLSVRAIARRLHCARRTVTAALRRDHPATPPRARRASLLDPYKARINALVAQCPELSAVRIREEIARGPDGYHGSTILVRRYLRTIRPARGRVRVYASAWAGWALWERVTCGCCTVRLAGNGIPFVPSIARITRPLQGRPPP